MYCADSAILSAPNVQNPKSTNEAHHRPYDAHAKKGNNIILDHCFMTLHRYASIFNVKPMSPSAYICATLHNIIISYYNMTPDFFNFQMTNLVRSRNPSPCAHRPIESPRSRTSSALPASIHSEPRTTTVKFVTVFFEEQCVFRNIRSVSYDCDDLRQSHLARGFPF